MSRPTHYPPPHRPGPHELSQNFLIDRNVIARVAHLAGVGEHPLVEWAAGDGAITRALAGLGRPLEAVEVDPRSVRRLRRRVPSRVRVTEMDILRHHPPEGPWTLVCNVPFHLTTPVLRRLLGLPGWDRAVLITQWEVARKRAGVGGATQLTAQWWPWFTFTLDQRVAATAFVPRPSVDAGLLLVERRDCSLVGPLPAYQRWVRQVFTGSGRGMPEILVRSGGLAPAAARAWCHRERITSRHLPRDLTAEQWASAFLLAAARRSGDTD